MAENREQWSVHDWQPFGLAPGDPLVDHGFLELGVAVQASLWVQSGDVLSDCLGVENRLVVSLEVWELSSQSRCLLACCNVDLKLGACNLGHSLNHEAHLIRSSIKMKIQSLLIDEKLPLVMNMITSNFVALGVPLLGIVLIVGF